MPKLSQTFDGGRYCVPVTNAEDVKSKSFAPLRAPSLDTQIHRGKMNQHYKAQQPEQLHFRGTSFQVRGTFLTLF